jgi:hypothetical protein
MKIIVFLISIIFIPQIYANETIPNGRVLITDYSKNGEKYGCALVRNKTKFIEALRIYGWSKNSQGVPELNWDNEVAVISTGADMIYLNSEVNTKNTTIIVKWKKKPLKDSGPIKLPGGAIMWGGTVRTEQTMVVILPRNITADKKVMCMGEG